MNVIFKGSDESIDFTPVTAVAAGDVVVQGGLVCVAKRAIPAGTLGALATRGRFIVPKVAEAHTAGELVYWDPVALCVTATPGALKAFGRVEADSAATDATVVAMLIQTAA